MVNVAVCPPLHYAGGDGCCGHQSIDGPGYFQTGDVRVTISVEGKEATHLSQQIRGLRK